MPRWILSESAPQNVRQSLVNFPPLIAGLLYRRGITTAVDAAAFLNPDFKTGVHDPFVFKNMRSACDRVLTSLRNNEKILVHGDYDADGLCGSALITGVLKNLSQHLQSSTRIFTFHPHREKDGYGIRIPTIEHFASQQTKLMITVDCGIGCPTGIARATELGIDTIVVDHHEFDPANLPKCILLHPRLPEETYPFKYLAAVGVAYKFACALLNTARDQGIPIDDGAEKWLLDLVAIATVTDVMPLTGENRVLEKFGLIVLNKTRRPGLKAIIETAGLTPGKIDTVSIGFGIGPRLNAASRMDHASAAFEALMSEEPGHALVAAGKLDQLNKDRQKYTEEIYRAAKAQAATDPDDPVIIVKGEGWSAGIVGLVAGKLVTEFGKPAFVFGQEGEKMVGSGRTVRGYNVVTAMERAKENLFRFGGHPQACGLTIIGEENYQAFKQIALDYAVEFFGDQILEPELSIDGQLKTSDITPEFIDSVLALEPFGEGNPRPKFAINNARITGLNYVGKTKNHVQLSIRGDAPSEFKLIGFSFAEECAKLAVGNLINVLVEVGVNEWNGLRRPEFRIVDLQSVTQVPSTNENVSAAAEFSPEPEYTSPMYVI